MSGRGKGNWSKSRSARSGSRSASPFIRRPTSSVSKSRLRLRRTLNTGLLLAILALVVLSLILQPTVKVVASSTLYHPVGDYQAAADSVASSLDDRTKITFNGDQLIAKLKSAFPEISDAAVELPLLGRQASLRLSVAAPTFVLLSGGKTYVLDSEGVVVNLPSREYKKVKFTTIVDNSGLAIRPGSSELGPGDLEFIKQILAQAKAAGVPVASLILPPLAQEIDLKTTDQPYLVKFYLAGNAATQAGQFLAARHQFVKDGIAPSSYLDVRVAGKIYYK